MGEVVNVLVAVAVVVLVVRWVTSGASDRYSRLPVAGLTSSILYAFHAFSFESFAFYHWDML